MGDGCRCSSSPPGTPPARSGWAGRGGGGCGRVLSRAQILDHVWEYDFGGNTNVVDTYVSYLRKKVDRVEPALIQTVRGVGYSLRLD